MATVSTLSPAKTSHQRVAAARYQWLWLVQSFRSGLDVFRRCKGLLRLAYMLKLAVTISQHSLILS